jgi:hypothetical protein
MNNLELLLSGDSSTQGLAGSLFDFALAAVAGGFLLVLELLDPFGTIGDGCRLLQIQKGLKLCTNNK